MISYALGAFLSLYNLLLLIRCFLTWIPSINWWQQPFAFLSKITDPVLNIFRGIIPPIGGVLDISPMLAFIALQIVAGMLIGLLNSMGL